MNGGWGHQKRPDRLGRMVAKITLSTTAMDIDDPLPSPRLVHHNDPTPVPRRSYAVPPVDAIPLSIHLGSRSVRTGLVGAHERRAGTGNGVPHGATVGDDIPPRTHAASTRQPFADGMQPHARCGLPIPANPCQSLPTPLAHLAYLCPTAWPRPQCFARQVESTYNNLNFVLLRL